MSDKLCSRCDERRSVAQGLCRYCFATKNRWKNEAQPSATIEVVEPAVTDLPEEDVVPEQDSAPIAPKPKRSRKKTAAKKPAPKSDSE